MATGPILLLLMLIFFIGQTFAEGKAKIAGEWGENWRSRGSGGAAPFCGAVVLY